MVDLIGPVSKVVSQAYILNLLAQVDSLG
jgi:hypothetical protein